MGFERIVKVFTLTFPDGKYEGLEVRMRSLTTDQFLDVTELADFAGGKKAISESAPELRKLCGWVADNMRSWNLEDDGQPVPVSLAALMDQEFEFVMDIVGAWLTGLGGTPPPLPASSNGTGRHLEASIPMVPLSPSLSS